ncbi:MAG: M15 family metallopeptidase [Spirosomaceae bacterium]|nr:M15 family metallopeptidase [Spirosomataceae bacterium]
MCSLAEKKVQTPTSWQTERCDTTARLVELTIQDLLVPFLQADSLKDSLKTTPRVYWGIVEGQQLQRWGVLTAFSPKHRPQNLILPEADTLTWLDRAYLWTLADRPDYPYDRYEPLLRDARRDFLTRRDSMVQQYRRQYPQYRLKVQSDLRGAGYQRRNLSMGKSVSPLSQHNFGFANDIGIWYKGGQLQNIRFYKTFLGDIGGQQGLTWGGTFLGFIDPNHVQYFKNSAEMLQKFPELRMEFEPYQKYFKNRVARMTAVGKAAKVEDTKALLDAMAAIHASRACVCDSLAERPQPRYFSAFFAKLTAYQPQKDIVVFGDLGTQTATLIHPSGFQKTFRLGRWE